MPRFGPNAYYEGQNLPRCTATPTPTEDDPRPGVELDAGQWECTLPAGHETYDDPRLQPHSWGEVA